MNLVRIAEDLKDVPMQALQAYMNGQNPEVPPYLAAAELQRRQAQQQRVQSAQAAEGAGAPSIKEQLEQATGLMALQQQKQGQAMQQLMGQAGNAPAPAPEDVPQPEPQPEVEMANGGIVRLPIRDDMFEYAGGGIIGYQAGGKTYVPWAEQINRQMKEKGSIYDPDFGKPAAARLAGRRDRKLEDLQERLQSLQNLKARVPAGSSLETRVNQDIATVQQQLQEVSAGSEAGIENLRIQGSQMAGITDQPPAVPTPKAPATAAGIATIAPKPEIVSSPTANQPAAATLTPGQASRQTADVADVATDESMMGPVQPTIEDEARRIIEERIRKGVTDYTPEQAAEAEGKLYSSSGLAALEAQREKMRQEYEATKKGRGFDNLIATLAGGAQGYGGSAAAYIGAKRAQEARDLQFAKDLYALESEPASKRYGTQGTLYRDGRSETKGERADQLKLAADITGIGRSPVSTTEVERLTAEVERLYREGRYDEAEKKLRLIERIRGIKPDQYRESDLVKAAIEDAAKAVAAGVIKRGEEDKYIENFIKRNKKSIARGLGQESAATGATGATGTTMPSASKFKQMAEELKKKATPQ